MLVGVGMQVETGIISIPTGTITGMETQTGMPITVVAVAVGTTREITEATITTERMVLSKGISSNRIRSSSRNNSSSSRRNSSSWKLNKLPSRPPLQMTTMKVEVRLTETVETDQIREAMIPSASRPMIAGNARAAEIGVTETNERTAENGAEIGAEIGLESEAETVETSTHEATAEIKELVVQETPRAAEILKRTPNIATPTGIGRRKETATTRTDMTRTVIDLAVNETRTATKGRLAIAIGMTKNLAAGLVETTTEISMTVMMIDRENEDNNVLVIFHQ
jgi:hypothetical protein